MPALGLLLVTALVGCDLSTGPTGPVADVRGTWDFTGSQAVPSLSLAGTLVIVGQQGDAIGGSMAWTETDGLGVVVARGGQVNGSVIGLRDIDFTVTDDVGERRFVAELDGDTLMVGIWAAVGSSATGEFRAVRR